MLRPRHHSPSYCPSQVLIFSSLSPLLNSLLQINYNVTATTTSQDWVEPLVCYLLILFFFVALDTFQMQGVN